MPTLCLGLFFCSGAIAAPTLDECDARTRDAPSDPFSYYCYVLAAQASGRFDEAVRKLEAIYRLHPDRARALLSLASLERHRRSFRAEDLYEQAVEKTAAAGDAWGEVYARSGLAMIQSDTGRFEQAELHLSRAAEVADASGDPIMQAHAWTRQAVLASQVMDYGRSMMLFKKAERLVFPDGPVYLRSWIYSGLGADCWAVGDLRRAMGYYRKEANLLRETGDIYNLATSLSNIALMAGLLSNQGQFAEQDVVVLIEEALETAIAGKNPAEEASIRLLLGQSREGAAAIEEYEAALAIARRLRDDGLTFEARNLIGWELLTMGPSHREALLENLAVQRKDAAARADLHQLARIQTLLATDARRSRSREQAIAAGRELLDIAEKIRDLQPDETVRARLFSAWAEHYEHLAGWIVSTLSVSATVRDDLERAFRIVERMRSRMLLDTLSAAGASSAGRGDEEAHDERGQLLHEISRVQKRLLEEPLNERERVDALSLLERLEEEEIALRERIARRDRRFRDLRVPDLARLAKVQAALRSNEAMISYHTWTHRPEDEIYRRGRPWAFVITREDVEIVPIQREDDIAERVGIFLGLLGGRDASSRRAGVRLFDDLLGPALTMLPDKIERLVIVPDGPLHRLPFSALIDGATGTLVGSRYDISYVPSATLWLRWRRKAPAPIAASVLALADPDRTGPAQPQGYRSAGPWITGLHLGRLAHAREEAASMIEGIGAGVLWSGRDAAESLLKSTDLSTCSVLHFAVHAVIDDARPERSAIVLAPGSSEEDGLLQVREITEIDLHDKAVILSACRSATGTLLEGEGSMGLAHAFFRAGARVVVGALWPLEDAETALIVEEFSHQLGRGLSVGSALAAAKRSCIRRGMPPAAWAGLVILGDADLVLVSDEHRRPTRMRGYFATGASLVIVLAALYAMSKRRRAGA